MAIEKFKLFFNLFQENYVNHFNTLDGVFEKRLIFLGELKAKFEQKAEDVNKQCSEQQKQS